MNSIKTLAITLAIGLFSMQPLALELNLEAMQAGDIKIVEWQARPVYIYKRSATDISNLEQQNHKTDIGGFYAVLYELARLSGNAFPSLLLDSLPLEENPLRSSDENYLVILGLSTNRGCAVSFKEESKRFYDPCLRNFYDLSGRRINGNSKEYHLLIPPHSIENHVLNISDEAEKIIDFTPDIQSLNLPADEATIEAMYWKQFDLAASLIQEFPEVISYENSHGGSLLHIAASRANPDLLEQLISAGADINKMTKEGLSPLHLALMTRKKVNIEFLLANGAQIEGYCKGKLCQPNIKDYLRRAEPFMSDDQLNEYIESLWLLRNSQ